MPKTRKVLNINVFIESKRINGAAILIIYAADESFNMMFAKESDKK